MFYISLKWEIREITVDWNNLNLTFILIIHFFCSDDLQILEKGLNKTPPEDFITIHWMHSVLSCKSKVFQGFMSLVHVIKILDHFAISSVMNWKERNINLYRKLPASFCEIRSFMNSNWSLRIMMVGMESESLWRGIERSKDSRISLQVTEWWICCIMTKIGCR